MSEKTAYREFPQIKDINKKEVSTEFKKIKNKYSIEDIKNIFNDLNHSKVLIIGDAIIDEYVFSLIKGRAIKDPILSAEYIYSEKYAGGILAIANHVANFANKVELITLLGDKRRNEEFIKEKLNNKIKLKVFTKENAYTTIKKRYINKQRNEKLFKVEFMTDEPIKKELSDKICKYLSKNLSKFDLVMVGDFGHGFINQEIINLLETKSKFLAINVQTNSANLGFNYITKYNKTDFSSMDLREIQHALQDRWSDYDSLMRKFSMETGNKQFLVTLGKSGAKLFKENKIYSAPIYSSETKDTVGAGDAVFSITALLAYKKINPEIIPFFANCVGGVAVRIMGNKESINKKIILSFIGEIYEMGKIQTKDN